MNKDARLLLIYSAACLGGVWVHEIGHALFGWMRGVPVLPTFAREYILQPQIEWLEKIWISLGGVVATAILITGALLSSFPAWRRREQWPAADAVLAGVLLPAGLYTLRFLLVGRGHDGLEWQEAQSAIGADPAGHAVDLLFLCLFVAGCATLAARRGISLRWKAVLRVAGLSLAGMAMIVILQVANNAVFNRFFSDPTVLHVPAGFPRE